MQNDYNLSVNAIDTNQSSGAVWAVIFFLTTLGALTATYWFYKQANSSQIEQKHFQQKQQNLSNKIAQLLLQLNNEQDKQKLFKQENDKINKQNQALNQQIGSIKEQHLKEIENQKIKTNKQIEQLQEKVALNDQSTQQQLQQLKDFNHQLIESVDLVQSYQQEKSELQNELSQLKEKYQTLALEKEQLAQQFKQYQLQQKSKQQKYLEQLNLSQEQNAKDAMMFNKLLTDSNLRINNLKNRFTVIELGQDIMYDPGGADLTEAGTTSLDKLADILKQFPDRQIAVQGHSDNRPIGKTLKDKYFSNWELSSARAASAIRYLQYNSLLKPERLILVAYSSYQPKVISNNEQDLARNRRIEIILLPKEFVFFKQSLQKTSETNEQNLN
ncbi:MAG: OmpA family protein [Gammaproteobacteria bacterium]|nr:OmpA family protein [Gammaproteobacteria bacterium]